MSDLDHPLMQMAIAAAEESATALPYGHNLGDQMLVINQGTVRLATVIIATSKRVTVRWTNSVRTITRVVTPTSSIQQWKGDRQNRTGLLVTALSDREKTALINGRFHKLVPYINELSDKQMGIAQKPYDLTGAIIEYEAGELPESEYYTLFSHLIKTGMAWTLQGSYGRTAAALIEGGRIARNGDILVPA